MSTSDEPKKEYGTDYRKDCRTPYREEILRTAYLELAVSLLCALFGAVYELYSHGVYSYYMLYAFAVPLGLGVFPLLSVCAFGRVLPSRTPLSVWNAGLAALTVGCLFRGVLDIYGTTNRLLIVYPVAGGLLLALSVLLYTAHDRAGVDSDGV